MSVTAEATMAMPHGNATEAETEDQPSSEVVIKPPMAVTTSGTGVRAVVDDVRRAWLFTDAPPKVTELLAQLRDPRVTADNAALKLALRAYLVAWGIPTTWICYGLAWSQQHPARAVVIDSALAYLAYVWLH